MPLVEIVSGRTCARAAEARDYLDAAQRDSSTSGSSDGNMEEGRLRCDANVSVRPAGRDELGTKTEVKNINSFRNVARAIEPRSSARSR